MTRDDSRDRLEAPKLVLDELSDRAAKLDHLKLYPATLHVAKALLHVLVLPLLDVLPEILAKDVDTIQQLLLCLFVRD